MKIYPGKDIFTKGINLYQVKLRNQPQIKFGKKCIKN